MTTTSAPNAGPLDLTFTATLVQEPGPGGWTYVRMDGSADVFATRGLVRSAVICVRRWPHICR